MRPSTVKQPSDSKGGGIEKAITAKQLRGLISRVRRAEHPRPPGIDDIARLPRGKQRRPPALSDIARVVRVAEARPPGVGDMPRVPRESALSARTGEGDVLKRLEQEAHIPELSSWVCAKRLAFDACAVAMNSPWKR